MRLRDGRGLVGNGVNSDDAIRVRLRQRDRVASTGPPLDGGGDVPRAPGRRRDAAGASTGPPLDGGGDISTAVDQFRPDVLQRGRRSMAAVTRHPPSQRCVSEPASTGPPLDGGGDLLRRLLDSGSTHRLQRGRRSMAAVTSAPPCASGFADPLQRGRRSMAAVTRQPGRQRRRPWKLQRGRRSMAAVTGGDRCGGGGAVIASTGPPLDGGGDSRICDPSASSNNLLQRGRRSMAAVTCKTIMRSAILAMSGFNGAAARWRR